MPDDESVDDAVTLAVTAEEYDAIKALNDDKAKEGKVPNLMDYAALLPPNDPRLDTIVACAHHGWPMCVVPLGEGDAG